MEGTKSPSGAPAKACILNLPHLGHEDAAGQDCPRWRNTLQAKNYLHSSGILDELVEAAASLPVDRIITRMVSSPGRGSVLVSVFLQGSSPCALDAAAARITNIWCDNLLGAHSDTLRLEGAECDVFRAHVLDRKRARPDDELFTIDVTMKRAGRRTRLLTSPA